MWMYVCMYAYMYICMYVSINLCIYFLTEQIYMYVCNVRA